MKKFRDSKWALALVPTFVAALLTLIVDWVKKIDIFSTLKSVVSTLWQWLLVVLNFEVKVWVILVILGTAFAILCIVAKIADSKDVPMPAWLQYTEDYFNDWKWSWTWERNIYGKYQVENLAAHCPHCGTPMRHDNYDTIFHCSRCGYESRRHTDNRQDIMVVIYDNVLRKNKQ